MKFSQKLLSLLCLLILAGSTFAQSAPPLMGLDGKSTSLDPYKGKVVLLNFWATWCAPCLLEMPELNQASRQLDAQRSVILGVAADGYDGVKAFVQQQGIGYPIAVGDPDQVFGWTSDLGNFSEGLPFSVMLDVNGDVIWKQEGGALTSEQVLQLINNQLAATDG